MNTNALHVSTRRLTSFQHGDRPYSTHTDALWQVFFVFCFFFFTLHWSHTFFFLLHGSISRHMTRTDFRGGGGQWEGRELSVTTVEWETSPNEVGWGGGRRWVTDEACLCAWVMSSGDAGDATWRRWPTNHWRGCSNTEHNNNNNSF